MTTIIFKNTVYNSQSTIFDQVEKYINDFFSLMPEGVNGVEDIDELLSPSGVITAFFSASSENGGRVGRFFAMLMLSAIVAYLASVYSGRLSPFLESCICVVSLTPAVYELISLAAEVSSGIDKMSVFFSSLIPLLLSVMIASGCGGASAVSGVQMSVVASAVQVISAEILLPMVRAMLILGGLSAIDGSGAERLILTMKNVFTKGLGFASTVVCSLFALQSIIAGAADTAALRLAKFTAQSIVPSVGAIITASMSTLSSGLAYARGVIGAGAIGAIVWIMLSPLAVLLLYRLAVEVCLGFAKSLGVKSYSRGLSAIQYALDGLISIFIVSGVLFIFQLVIFIKNGSEI